MEKTKQQLAMAEEISACEKSPYYFATKYLTINGQPFTTHLSEEEFNEQFNKIYLKPTDKHFV